MLIGHTVSDNLGRLIAIDHDASEILQRTEQEVLGVSYAKLTHGDDQERNVSLVSRLSDRDRPLMIKKRYVRPDGSAIWALVQASRMSARGGGMLVGTLHLSPAKTESKSPKHFWHSARQLEAHLRRRRAELGPDLFTDYAWAIILQIYLAEAEGRIVSENAICELADVHAGSVRRWLKVLEQKEMIYPSVSAASVGQLTAKGAAKVETLLHWNLRNQDASRV